MINQNKTKKKTNSTLSLSQRCFNFCRHFWCAKTNERMCLFRMQISRIYDVRVDVHSLANARSVSRRNLEEIRTPKEEFHKDYYEVDRHDRVNLDSVDQLLSKQRRKCSFRCWIRLTCERSWPKRKLNNDVRWTFGLKRVFLIWWKSLFDFYRSNT